MPVLHAACRGPGGHTTRPATYGPTVELHVVWFCKPFVLLVLFARPTPMGFTQTTKKKKHWLLKPLHVN